MHMNFKFRRLLGIAVFLTSVLSLAVLPVFAETDDSSFVFSAYEPVKVDTDCLPSSEELFAGYLEEKMYEDLSGGISLFGMAAGDYLTDGSLEKNIYTNLKGQLAAVADGTQSSTILSVNTGLSSLNWTAEELGCSIIEGGTLSAAAQSAIDEKFRESLDITRIFNCLLADCPYELYWFDKTQGLGINYKMSYNSSAAQISQIKFFFSVASSYKSADYETDTSKTGAASNAVKNAKAIAEKYKNKTDLEKLEAYRDEICSLVSYNHETGSEYGDPWQIIYVFDGDPDTNVVCEGYSKAFQYLCDLSEFCSDVTCFTVSGVMSSSSGSGGHMWNVVELNGRNRLVDVTNCDTGTVGAPDKLFLVSVYGTEEGRTHTFTIGSKAVTYTYDTDQKDLFCDGYLALTPPTDYEILSYKNGTAKIYSPENKSAVVILAEMSGNRLVNSKVTPCLLSSGENSINIGTLSAGNAKIMLWNGMSDLTPLCVALPVTQ